MRVRYELPPAVPALWVLLVIPGCFISSEPEDRDTSTDTGTEQADETEVRPCEPAADFALEDLNPASPTYEETRNVSDQVGKVLLINFANFG
jgi:hypothetical protein